MASKEFSEPWVLTLDVGTSSCRVGIRDATARALPGSTARRSYSPRFTQDGGAELDPRTLFDELVSALDETHAATPGPVSAASLGTFWHSLVGVDAAGEAITPVYLWSDSRSRTEMASLRRELDPVETHRRTGCVLHWSYWPAKLRWLANTQPHLLHRVDHWSAFGDWALLRLLGRRVSSLSLAAATGLLHQQQCTWDEPVLQALPLRASQLAPLTGDREWLGTLRPEFAARWPIFASARWLPAMGDGALNSLGAGCTRPELSALMVGTSAALRVLGPADRLSVPDGCWGYRVDRQRLCVGGALNDGGGLFAWMRQTLQLPEPAVLEAQLAAMPPDSHGLTLLPLWGGERSPGWAENARGAISGLGFHTRPVELVRAALEGIALRCLLLDARLQAVSSGAADATVATGGALTASPAWAQIMADALGRPLLASDEPEASSRGAAWVALEALEHLPHGWAGIPPPTGRVFTHDPAATARYRAAAERQSRMYDQWIRDT